MEYTRSRRVIVNTRNRMLSQNLYMSMDTRHTDLNNNILVVGGSGAGKTFRFVKPSIMQMTGSYIITDPKGEIMRDCAGFLEQNGYEVKVLNLLNADEMKKSTHYNPFSYIKSDTDIIKLITNLISNTTPKDSKSSDPFWENAEAITLQALFYYVWYEGYEVNGKKQKNIPAVMELLKKAEFVENDRGQKMDSELDLIFAELEEKSPNHPAVINYNKVMRGAADTVRSVILSVNARLKNLQTKEILDLLSEDEMEIPTMGSRKTALFCIIPDNDKSYNFLIGMLYSQIFQELYYQADFVHGGRLPVHVTFLLDEFANVALPDDYCSLLSTMRSREISSIIIIQNLAQIKKLFKDDWETIPGNCDTLIYLGGNEKETHKYISELMGKKTIDKYSTSVSKGKNGSSSKSDDVLGREIMLPDEVRRLEGKKCIIFIRGYDVIIDDKIHTLEHPLWTQLCESQKGYVFDARLRRLKSESLLLSADKFARMENEERKRLETYQYEKEIAEKTGAPIPDQPAKQVVELSIAEFIATFKEATEHFEEISTVNISEQTMQNNVERVKNHEDADTGRFEKQLKEEGYTDEQVNMLLLYSCQKINKLFNSNMEPKIMKQIMEQLG